jgi:spore coat protein CotH
MRAALAICSTLIFATLPSVSQAQTSDELFAPGTLHDVRLFMNSRDLRLLREAYAEDTYHQADLEWRGLRVRSVAVRSAGSGSRNPAKPAIRIDFDRFSAGQRYLGLESLLLDNVWQDASLVRESVVMALFARLGHPAPRESFARLFINDVYQGLYAVVEPIDPVFLARTFGDADGYLFEYSWQNEFHGEYLGQSLGRYKTKFEPESHRLDADSTLYAPLHDLFREINAPISGTWRQSVEPLLDVPRFLTHVAIETFVSELDGILGSWAMNNFYVYRPTGSSQHLFLPWDRDNAFQTTDSSVMLRASDNMLMRRLLEHPDLRAFYLNAVEQTARAASGWLEQEIAAKTNLIRAAAHADERKQFSNAEFETEIAFLRSFAQTRPGVVLAEVARLR